MPTVVCAAPRCGDIPQLSCQNREDFFINADICTTNGAKMRKNVLRF
jgi:hypothetical protein